MEKLDEGKEIQNKILRAYLIFDVL